MPTKLLYLTNAYLKESEAKVASVKSVGNRTTVTLNQTIFYPKGGGQLGDQGEIIGPNGSIKVQELQYNNGTVQHTGKLTGSIAKGEMVQLKIDWDRRYRHMQEHTAGHIVDEAVKQVLPEFHGIEGMHGIGREYWIKYEGFLDEVHHEAIQQAVDSLVSQDLPIKIQFATKAEMETAGIIIPFKLPDNKPLRLIQIGDLPPAPDGGTQLNSTGEAKTILINRFEYLDGQTLIHYAVDQEIAPLNDVEVVEPNTAPKESGKPNSDTLNAFIQQLEALVTTAKTLELNEVNRLAILGKSGQLNAIAANIRTIPTESKKVAGQKLNQAKQSLEAIFAKMKVSTTGPTWFDATMPGTPPPTGHMHLISEAIMDIESIFSRIGFVRRRYPEIETDWYYAEGLNIPKDHPARDDQETFYLTQDLVLTAHTSNGQLREMEYMGKPPIKMINIGKTYRRQASNTHSPMFHQFEGLLIDEGINMSHLVGVSNFFAKEYFGPDREFRFRPHHFQFTEPSFEVDINCHICKSKGEINGVKCKVCKSGWLELGGAGMVHPTVLKNGGIDPEKYSGFAFGWGVERVIMLKHQVTDNLRELYTQDLRFLQQS